MQRKIKEILKITLYVKIFLLFFHFAFAAGSGSSNEDSNYKLDSNSPQILKDLVLLLKEEDYFNANDLAEKAVKNYPQNADAWNYLGFSSRKIGLLDESKIAYENALKINPKHTGALEYLGELFLTLKELDKAEEILARLDNICVFNCKEMEKLKKAINEFKKNN